MHPSLTRIIIFAGNVEKLKQFYQSNFKFSLLEEIKNEWLVLKAGQTEIAFHQVGEAYRNEAGEFNAESNTKLVFTIASDIHHFRNTLVEGGATMQEVKSFPGFNYLMCDGEDPEGNVFQIATPQT